MTTRMRNGFTGVIVVCAVLVFLFVTRLPPRDVATALQRGEYRHAAMKLEQARARGDMKDNFVVSTTLANLYFVGLGVTQSHSRAAALYSEAAFAGSIAAQVNMGHLYANGFGVQPDGKMAYAWFNIARTNGSKIAQLYMSELLAEHQISAQFVNNIRSEFATLDNFPRLH